MSAHTPTPWAQHEDEPRVIVSAAAPTMSLLGLDSDDTAIVWSAEDAALIVHRVNVHDELVAALKELVERRDAAVARGRASADGSDGRYARARAALALAAVKP